MYLSDAQNYPMNAKFYPARCDIFPASAFIFLKNTKVFLRVPRPKSFFSDEIHLNLPYISSLPESCYSLRFATMKTRTNMLGYNKKPNNKKL